MNSRDNTPANGHDHHTLFVSQAALDRIRTPLSVAHGYLQLVQRRIRRDHVLDSSKLVQDLDHMDKALRNIEKQLQELSRDTADQPPNRDTR